MQISDFPRPPEDNGRGVHWSARIYHPSGRDLDFWIHELRAMYIKWVKLLDDGDGSALELCRRLLDAGIMPVVRLCREQPHSGRLDGREVSGLRKLIAAGVRYFETHNQPGAFWLERNFDKDGEKPQDWPDIVDDFIYNAGIVLDEGGLPAVPAVGPAADPDFLRQIVDKGREDLFQRGTWLAIHNYTLNHPLDYPDDAVNQQGQPLTQADFERFPAWAWDHRSMEMINEQRARDKNPGQTLAQDANCFRGWEQAGKVVHDLLGYHIPVISTEGGPVAGRGDDLRYPKVTPDQQRDWQVEIVRFLQTRAPAWYFTCCTWLLASRPLGDWNPAWEQMSWYTDAWNERFGLAGQLPVVQALKDLPPQVRPELRQGTGALDATLLRADRSEPLANVAVALESMGERGGPAHRLQAQTDAQGRLALDRLPAGSYRLLAFNAEVGHVSLARDERRSATFKVQAGRRSQIRGRITDTGGAPQPDLPVTLHQASPPRLLAETRTDGDGAYGFRDLPASKLIVRVAPGTAQSTEQRNVVVDGWTDATVDMTVPPAVALRYEVVEKRLLAPEETGNENHIFGRILDENGDPLDGITVRMRWTGAGPETHFPTVKSGQNPFKPRGYFEFIHTPGVFMLDVLDGGFESQVADGLVTADMPGRSRPISYEVIFQRKSTLQPACQSSMGGRVLGGLPNLAVVLSGSGIAPRLAQLDAEGTFHFAELPAGIYQVSLEGIGIIAHDVILDGIDNAVVEFPMLGQIAGQVLPPDPPATVVLTCEQYSICQEDDVEASGEYRFSNLPADTYTLRLQNTNLPPQQVVCDGRTPVDGPTFDREMSEQGSIAGRVTDHRGAAVANTILWLRTLGRRVAEGQTDADGCYRFDRLGAGSYSLELVGVGLVAQNLQLNGADEFIQDVQLEPPAQGRIAGRLLDAQDRPVANRTLVLSGPTTQQTRSDDTGAFQFDALQAGDYVVHVADIPAVKTSIALDGEEHREITLRLPAAETDTAPPLGHYLLFTATDPAVVDAQLAQAIDYILRTAPVVGFNAADCTRARRVTIVGDPDAVLLQKLREQGIPCQQVTGNLENLQAELEALS